MLEHLADDRRALYATAHVCRGWFAPAIVVQWRPPSYKALNSMSSERAAFFRPLIHTVGVGRRRVQPPSIDPGWRFQTVAHAALRAVARQHAGLCNFHPCFCYFHLPFCYFQRVFC